MLPIAVQILLLLLLLYAIILKLHEPILQPTFNVGCRIPTKRGGYIDLDDPTDNLIRATIHGSLRAAGEWEAPPHDNWETLCSSTNINSRIPVPKRKDRNPNNDSDDDSRDDSSENEKSPENKKSVIMKQTPNLSTSSDSSMSDENTLDLIKDAAALETIIESSAKYPRAQIVFRI